MCNLLWQVIEEAQAPLSELYRLQMLTSPCCNQATPRPTLNPCR